MIDYIITHSTDLIAIVGGIVTVASIICKLTPTKKDDEIMGKIMRLINFIAINKKQGV